MPASPAVGGARAAGPAWRNELPPPGAHRARPIAALTDATNYCNAIGPVALGTAVTLAVASRGVKPVKRMLDAASAISLAGVLAATIMVTVPINKELEGQAPTDYPSDRSHSLAKNWSRAHAVRTTLGVSAFLCAVASNIARSRQKA
mgnify:CR=1 FL=1